MTPIIVSFEDLEADTALLLDMEAPTEVVVAGDFLNDDDDTSIGMWTINTGGC